MKTCGVRRQDYSIIHEMNHHMTSDELLFVESEKEERYISRSGLNVDGNDNEDVHVKKLKKLVESLMK